jgi:hypothetical protein
MLLEHDATSTFNESLIGLPQFMVEWRHLAPDSGLEARLRGGNRTVDVLCVAFRDVGDQLAVTWVDRLEGLATRGIDELAVDEQLRALHLLLCALGPLLFCWHCHGHSTSPLVGA